VSCIAFSPDGKRLVSGSLDETVKIWDVETGRELRTLKPDFGAVASVAYSADGRYIAAGGREAAKTWNVQTGRELFKLAADIPSVKSLAFSTDGKRLAAAGASGRTIICDLQTGEQKSVEDNVRFVTSGAFSPDGRRLATVHDGLAKVWDVETGRELLAIKGHGAKTNSVAFSSDGGRLATASEDGTVKIWDAATGRELLTPCKRSRGMSTAAFSPDGRYLAAVPRMGSIVVWQGFPWKADDYPGDETMAFDERVRMYRLAQWEEREEALRNMQALEAAMVARREREWQEQRERKAREEARALEACAENLQKIYVAIGRHRKEHDDEFPDWLSDLVPQYLTTETLLCSADNEGKVGNHPDPKMPCSYSYQFAVTSKISDPEYSSLRQWKTVQLEEFGDIVPLVRCPNHERRILNLTHGGNLYISGSVWERGVREPYRPSDTPLSTDTLSTQPGVLAFQQGAQPNPEYTGCADAHIWMRRPQFNAGACMRLEEGDLEGGATNHRKMLVRFDLASAPTTYPLRRAELRLLLYGERSTRGQAPRTLYAARILKPWIEGQVTSDMGTVPRDNAVTYNSARHDIGRWEKPGAMGATDVADAESSTTAGENWPEWITLDVTESVRYFLKHPDENFGWKISQDSERGDNDSSIMYEPGVHAYKSSEAPELHLRPLLILFPMD
jgi:hypothetical protein